MRRGEVLGVGWSDVVDGSGVHPERLSRWFTPRCRKADLPVVGVHDVRHSYVTALRASGVPLGVVSQRAGHASPMVTPAIYQHVTASA